MWEDCLSPYAFLGHGFLFHRICSNEVLCLRYVLPHAIRPPGHDMFCYHPGLHRSGYQATFHSPSKPAVQDLSTRIWRPWPPDIFMAQIQQPPTRLELERTSTHTTLKDRYSDLNCMAIAPRQWRIWEHWEESLMALEGPWTPAVLDRQLRRKWVIFGAVMIGRLGNIAVLTFRLVDEISRQRMMDMRGWSRNRWLSWLWRCEGDTTPTLRAMITTILPFDRGSWWQRYQRPHGLQWWQCGYRWSGLSVSVGKTEEDGDADGDREASGMQACMQMAELGMWSNVLSYNTNCGWQSTPTNFIWNEPTPSCVSSGRVLGGAEYHHFALLFTLYS